MRLKFKTKFLEELCSRTHKLVYSLQNLREASVEVGLLAINVPCVDGSLEGPTCAHSGSCGPHMKIGHRG